MRALGSKGRNSEPKVDKSQDQAGGSSHATSRTVSGAHVPGLSRATSPRSLLSLLGQHPDILTFSQLGLGGGLSPPPQRSPVSWSQRVPMNPFSAHLSPRLGAAGGQNALALFLQPGPNRGVVACPGTGRRVQKSRAGGAGGRRPTRSMRGSSFLTLEPTPLVHGCRSQATPEAKLTGMVEGRLHRGGI